MSRALYVVALLALAAPASFAAPPDAAPLEDAQATTTLAGKVVDSAGKPIDGAKVTARSLKSSVPWEAETTTAGGTYSFGKVPTGVEVEISASKPGFTTRRRVEVLKSNKTGDPNARASYDLTLEAAAPDKADPPKKSK